MSESINWKEVYDLLLPRVYHFFWYRTGDPILAEELTSATFEKAWAGRKNYNHNISQFPSWVFGIAKKVAADHFRHRRPEVPIEAVTVPANQNTEKDVEIRLDCEYLASLLAAFPERERNLLALKYGAELNNREIAKLTGLSETNVGTILYRVVSQLREKWSLGS